jgi:hypothetical protein
MTFRRENRNSTKKLRRNQSMPGKGPCGTMSAAFEHRK